MCTVDDDNKGQPPTRVLINVVNETKCQKIIYHELIIK